MKISIDGRSALFYNGSGIGNYSSEIINKLLKINKEDSIKILPKNTNIPKFSSFWELSKNPIELNDKCDVFFNPHNGIGLPNKNANKIVTTLHDIIPSKLPKTVSESYLKIYNENIYKILKKSSYILTVSNFSKLDIMETFNINENKIFVTHLSPSKIYRPINQKLALSFLKKTFNINYNYILYIGGFSPRKNITRLIEAFSKVHDHNKKIKLIIVGTKGKSYNDYLNRCIKLNLINNVIFTGFVKTLYLPLLYNCASCFIYPSLYEGFGLPPLESMACGTPTIASNLTSIPEVLGTATLYINPYDVDDIYEKINLILNNNKIRSSIIINGLNHVKNFSWEKTSLETLKIIYKAKEC